jgi:hypothetical protein
MAVNVDLLIDKGATFRHTFKWFTESAGVKSAVSLAGYTARMKIRLKKGDPDPPLEDLTTGNGRIILEPASETGRIDLLIARVDTTAYTWSSGVYDLELIAPSTEVTRLVQGRVAANDEVTT